MSYVGLTDTVRGKSSPDRWRESNCALRLCEWAEAQNIFVQGVADARGQNRGAQATSIM